MGEWYWAVLAAIVTLVVYGWLLYAVKGKFWPVFVLILCSIGAVFGLFHAKEFLAGIFVIFFSLFATIFYYVFSPEKAEQEAIKEDDAMYIVTCWNCGRKFDVRQARVCHRCHQQFVCPHCHVCRCANPDYDKSVEEKIERAKKMTEEDIIKLHKQVYEDDMEEARRAYSKTKQKQSKLAIAMGTPLEGDDSPAAIKAAEKKRRKEEKKLMKDQAQKEKEDDKEEKKQAKLSKPQPPKAKPIREKKEKPVKKPKPIKEKKPKKNKKQQTSAIPDNMDEINSRIQEMVDNASKPDEK